MFVRSATRTQLSHSFVLTGAVGCLLACCGLAKGGPVAWKNAQAISDTGQVQRAASEQIYRDAARRNAALGRGGYLIVGFDQTPEPRDRIAFQRSGLTLLSPIGGGGYFARVDPGADVSALSDLTSTVGPIRAEHKLHPAIWRDEMPDWAVVGGVLEASSPDGPRGAQTVAAYVMMHPDVDAASPEISQMVLSHKGVVRSVVMSMNTVVVEMPLNNLKRLANDERVQWIEPPLPPLEPTNASNRVITQVNAAQSAPYSLDGTGVTVLVYDGGSVRASHADFSGRLTNIDSSAMNYHSTHVAGTIGGDGSVSINNKGMAPGVNLLAAGFEVAGGLDAGFLYTDPGDLEADYSQALSLGASISNNSIGSNVAQNGYPCSWHGDYGITAGTIDNLIRGSLGEPITVFWAAGNERGSGRCGTGYGTTAPPGNNKNAITVGAVNSDDDSMTDFSSWGPSEDGRIRPVISAPGCQNGGDNGVTSTGDGSDSQYISLCGTSMASPTAAGIGALIVQDFRAQHPQWGDPSNQLMKVILVQGAVDILNPGPDFQSGYGSIRAIESIDFVRSGNFDEGSVDQGSSSSFTVSVDPGDPVFRVTIAWDDPAGAPNVSPALVNDLDLVVIDPSGVRHYPWTLDPQNPAAPAVQDSEDHLNNIEQVFVENPATGVWRVQVVGASVSDGPQAFALASALDLGEGLLSVELLESPAQAVLPGEDIVVVGVINEGVDTVVPGSVVLNSRYGEGAFSGVAMIDNGGGTYSATIPGGDCGEFVEYFISATGSSAGAVYSPPLGAGGPARSEIGEVRVVLSDNFETDTGWGVSGDTTDGAWSRGVPVDCSSRGAPGSDSDGSGRCWITDNDAANSCNSDVDNGTTILTSPIYSMPDGGEFRFDYWYSDIPTGEVNGDQWVVEGSVDGGENWVTLRASTIVSSQWRSDAIVVGEEIGSSERMRFRFVVDDVGDQNVIEAGLDHIRITRFVCDEPAGCVADFAQDGTLNFLDVSAFLAAFGVEDPRADLLDDGAFNFLDVSQFLLLFSEGCP